MNLIPDFHKVFKYAMSVRFMLIAAILTGAEAVLQIFTPVQPSPTFSMITFGVVVAAFVARFIAQPVIRGESDDTKPK